MTDISVKASDRAVLIGASGTGKSTLGRYLLSRFREDQPEGARILVLDTKPRWRGERLSDGTGTRRHYRNFVEGDYIPGAVVLQTMRDWPIAWHTDTNEVQTVIAQRIDGSQAANVRFQIQAAEAFFKSQRPKIPSLIYIDEGHDFFTPSATAIGGSDIVQRSVRAGREKGLATLIGMQRPKGLNPQVLTELNKCYLFRINYQDDIKRLYEMGWPKHEPPPGYGEEHQFKLWQEGRPEAPAYRLDIRKAA